VGSDHGGWQHEEAISSLHNHHKTQDFKYIFNCLLLSDISNINLIHKPRQSTSLLSFYSSTDKLSWTRSENLKALHLRIWLHLTGIMAISSILLTYWLSSKHACNIAAVSFHRTDDIGKPYFSQIIGRFIHQKETSMAEISHFPSYTLPDHHS
jgi:hypothetical protein